MEHLAEIVGSDDTISDEDPPSTTKNSLSQEEMILLQQDKAGLQNVDKQHVNKIIYEMSKNSKFFKNEQRKTQKTQERIKQLHEKLREIVLQKASQSPDFVGKSVIEEWRKVDWEKEEFEISKLVEQLEMNRDLNSTWIHIDMDAFFVSVELRDNPQLIGKPVAVGGKAMISTSNYEARKYGVRSAMPGFIALKLCPELILIRPNYEKYTKISKQIHQIFAEYDPTFKTMSLDEANLNVTEYLKNKYGSNDPKQAYKLAEEIRKRVYEKTMLTCSAGIAPNHMLSKICSDKNKPNGQFQLLPDRKVILEFMKKLPIRDVTGIGKVTEKILNSFNIKTCGDLFDSMCVIKALFSPLTFHNFLCISLGIPPERYNVDHSFGSESAGGRKRISKERTFKPTKDKKIFIEKLTYIAEALEKSMKKKNLLGRTISIRIKQSNFQTMIRSKTISKYTNRKQDMLDVVIELLNQELENYLKQNHAHMEIRLLGIAVSSFAENTRTLPEMFKNVAKQKRSVLEIKSPVKTPKINDLMKGDEAKKIVFECAVCQKQIEYNDTLQNALLNHNIHVDQCLLENQRKAKRRKISDYFTKSK